MIPDPNTTLSNLASGTYFQLIDIIEELGIWRELATAANLKQNEISYLQNSRTPSMSEAVFKYLTRYNFRVKHLVLSLKKIGAERALFLLIRPENVSISQEPPEHIYVSSGEELSVSCQAVCFPKPNYQWYFKTGIDEKFVDLPEQTTMNLAISNFGPKNAGFYGCLISNEDETGALLSEVFTRWTQVTVDGRISPLIKSLHPPAPSRLAEADHVSSLFTFTECKAEGKVALLIGNQAYHRGLKPLVAAHKDVQTLASSLSELGFNVIAMTDLNLEEMNYIVDFFCQLLGKGVYAVFYFVGHGFESEGQHYLLPVDAPPHFLRSMCLCAEDVLARMHKQEGFEPALSFFILDTCRKEAEGNSAIKTEQPVIYRPRVLCNTIFACATSFTCSAYEEAGASNGFFIKYLKKRIAQKKPLSVILDRVLSEISADSKVSGRQVPQVSRTLSVDVSLADPVLPENIPSSNTRREIFERLRGLPDNKEFEIDELGILVNLNFEHVGFIRNALYVYVSLTGSNRYFPCFSRIDNLPLTMDQSYQQNQQKPAVELKLSDLQKLDGELKLCLNIIDKDASHSLKVVREYLLKLGTMPISNIGMSETVIRKPVENEDTSLVSSIDSGFGSMFMEDRGVDFRKVTFEEKPVVGTAACIGGTETDCLPDLNRLSLSIEREAATRSS